MPVDPNAPKLKISLTVDGRIAVDGRPTGIDSLRVLLKRLAAEKGFVWYYREAPETPAPPESVAIIQAIIENRLPLRLSTRPDFSDAIGPDGRSISVSPD